MPYYQRWRIRRSKHKWKSVMKNNLIKITAAATVTISAAIFPTAAQARWHHGFPSLPL
ncbi:hypothetical protein [Bradyrhizobium sp. USDA 4471]